MTKEECALAPAAKRPRSNPGPKEEVLEIHHQELQQLLQQCTGKLTEYLASIESKNDEASTRQATRLCEGGKRSFDKLASDLDELKRELSINCERNRLNELGVCHRCCKGKDTTQLLECQCYSQNETLMPAESPSCGIRLCQNCITEIQADQKSILMTCAVCESLDCRMTNPAGRQVTVNHATECLSALMEVSPNFCAKHKSGSDGADSSSYTPLQHVCLDCLKAYCRTRPPTCDRQPYCFQQLTRPGIIPVMRRRHQDKLTGAGSCHSFTTEDIVRSILAYCDASEMCRFGLTCFANYQLTQAFAKHFMETTGKEFRALPPSCASSHSRDEFSRSFSRVEWCERFCNLERNVCRDFGFKFVNDYRAAQCHLHRKDALRFTDVYFDPPCEKMWVRGCQIVANSGDDFFDETMVAAICGNKSLDLRRNHYAIGVFRGKRDVVQIKVGLVTANCCAKSLCESPGSRWAGDFCLRLSGITEHEAYGDNTEAIFGFRYEADTKTLAFIHLAGDSFVRLDQPDDVFPGDWIIDEDRMHVNAEAMDLHWAVTACVVDPPESFPDCFTLRDCTEAEWKDLRYKIIDKANGVHGETVRFASRS